MMDELTEAEREMMLRALRDYSDHCHPPELHPECPFSVVSGPNLRTCEEQCMDVLGRFGAPRQVREVILDSDMVAHVPLRPRARRQHRMNEKPFDAAEVYLVDKDLESLTQWRLTALIYGVVDIAETSPPHDNEGQKERHVLLDALLAEIEQRGINVSDVVEPAIRRAIPRAIFGEILFAADQLQEDDVPKYIHRWLPSIRQVYDRELPESEAQARRKLNNLIDSLRNWSSAADFGEVRNWIPPSVPLGASDSASTISFDGDGRWIYDRFSSTYLQSWHSESLCKEWKYAHGEQDPPCAPREMREREIQEDELSKTMADRLTQSQRDQTSLADELKPAAIRYLKEGQLNKATTLFDAAVNQDPTDSEAINNLGFCLLPSDPERALACFIQASELGWSESVVSECNRILAVALAGRLTVALDFAHTFLNQHREAGLRGSYFMWDPENLLLEGHPILAEVDDLVGYAELIVTTVDTSLQRRISAQAEGFG